MTIYLTEYSGLAVSNGVPAQVGVEPALADQTVEPSNQSIQSQTFNRNTTYVRVNVDSKSPVHIALGSDPVATNTSRRLAPNQTEMFHVFQGHGYKLAVLQGTS